MTLIILIPLRRYAVSTQYTSIEEHSAIVPYFKMLYAVLP